jgi:hypothetical protein
MLIKKSRIVFAIIVICLSGYSLITNDFELMPYLMLFLAIFMLVTGFAELQKDRKSYWGYLSIIVSSFAFLVSIQSFLLK